MSVTKFLIMYDSTKNTVWETSLVLDKLPFLKEYEYFQGGNNYVSKLQNYLL